MSALLVAIIEVAIAFIVYGVFKKYIDYVIALITIFIPPVVLGFIIFGISVAIIIFIIRGND